MLVASEISVTDQIDVKTVVQVVENIGSDSLVDDLGGVGSKCTAKCAEAGRVSQAGASWSAIFSLHSHGV